MPEESVTLVLSHCADIHIYVPMMPAARGPASAVAGTPLWGCAGAIGHRSIQTTERYLCTTGVFRRAFTNLVSAPTWVV